MRTMIRILSFVLLFLLLTGCSTQRIGIIHDYMFRAAEHVCEPHEGLHYIVSISSVENKKNSPCHNLYKFRCQDQSLINFDDGVGFCVIQEMQLSETLETK